MSDAENRPKTSNKRKRSFTRILLVTGLILFFCVLIFHTTLLSIYGRFLNAGRPLEKPVDAVYVLGGDITTRPFTAVEIFKAGYASELIYCGLADLKDQAQLADEHEHNLLIKIMQHSGLSHINSMSIRDNANSTIDEAKALAEYLDKFPEKKVAIVTNNYHTRRAQYIIQHHCRKYNSQLYFVSAPTDCYDPESWWKSSEGRLRYSFEGLKLLTTFLPNGME